MVKNSIRYTIITCVLGYLIIVASAITASIIVGLVTGYFPSLTFFTLGLITFRLVEIHPVFLIAPPLVAILVMTILSKTPINKRIVAGLSMCSYYLIVTLVFVIMGAGEFPFELLLPWLLWVFTIGFVSSLIVDKSHA